jgi:hypothetical protein
MWQEKCHDRWTGFFASAQNTLSIVAVRGIASRAASGVTRIMANSLGAGSAINGLQQRAVFASWPRMDVGLSLV